MVNLLEVDYQIQIVSLKTHKFDFNDEKIVIFAFKMILNVYVAILENNSYIFIEKNF